MKTKPILLKSILISTLVISLLIGCTNSIDVKEKYFPDGKLFYTDKYQNGKITQRKTYSMTGDRISVINFKNGKFNSSIIYNDNLPVGEYSLNSNGRNRAKFYLKNANIYGQGKVDDFSREIGWWNLYDENRQLIEKRYSIVVGIESVVNQHIVYKNGKIDSLNSEFADVIMEKQTSADTYLAKLIYRRRIHKNSYVSLLISDKVKDDFTNIEAVIFDTIILNRSQELRFPITLKFKSVKKLRGYIIEQYTKEKITKDKPVNFIEGRTYFEKIINVDDVYRN